MSALILSEAFPPRQVAEMKAAQQLRFGEIIRTTRETALRDQNQWIDALHNLTGPQETAITHAVMHADALELYRLMRNALQAYVLEQATDRAKNEIFQRFGVDVDEVAK
jgi:hypothetical protein